MRSFPRLLRVLLLTTALLPCVGGRSVRADGELDELRREVREEREQSSDEPVEPLAYERLFRQRLSGSGDAEVEESQSFLDVLFEPVGEVVIFSTTAPGWVPLLVTGDRWDRRATFLDYPYQDNRPGYLVIETPTSDDADLWAARLSTEYGTNFSGLSRIGTRVVVDTTWRVAVEGQWNEWFEEDGGGLDQLTLGEANLLCRFAQSDRMQFYVGPGVNWLDDAAGTEYGFNLTYGADFQPRDPWIVSAAIDWGTLGSTTLLRLRSTVGVQVNRVETFIGYEHLKIGGAELNGLVAGGRISF